MTDTQQTKGNFIVDKYM